MWRGDIFEKTHREIEKTKLRFKYPWAQICPA